VVSKYRLQVVCAALATVEARKALAQAQLPPVVTYTEYVPAANCTRLFLGEFASNASFSVRNAFRNQMISKGLAGTDSFWKIVGSGTPLYVVTRGTDVMQTSNPITLASSTAVVTINGVAYHGSAEVRVNTGGTLAGINQVPLEQYLYGVVPAELSPVIWPELEAIKAQAVAARTYALAGMGKRGADGYDLLATTADQVYGGIPYERSMSNEAVDATRGQVATYEGRLISALYSSTSGGHTADNEEAFNSAPVPYLRGAPDEERGEALEHVPSLDVFRAAANPRSLRAVRSGQFEEDWSRWHRWTYEWSPAEMSTVVSLFAGAPVGDVLAVNVLERGPSGRAVRLEFVTEAGSFYATRDAIRAALKYIPAGGAPTNLPSTLFFIEPVLDHRTGEPDGFRVFGGGLGHGVGLSQTGAVGMAQRGHSYQEILKHYYQGIELTTWP
jgi:stage II sporulation protein D